VGIIRETEMCFYEAFFQSCVKGTLQRDLPPRTCSPLSRLLKEVDEIYF
jgi:hypothetical protein